MQSIKIHKCLYTIIMYTKGNFRLWVSSLLNSNHINLLTKLWAIPTSCRTNMEFNSKCHLTLIEFKRSRMSKLFRQIKCKIKPTTLVSNKCWQITKLNAWVVDKFRKIVKNNTNAIQREKVQTLLPALRI